MFNDKTKENNRTYDIYSFFCSVKLMIINSKKPAIIKYPVIADIQNIIPSNTTTIRFCSPAFTTAGIAKTVADIILKNKILTKTTVLFCGCFSFNHLIRMNEHYLFKHSQFHSTSMFAIGRCWRNKWFCCILINQQSSRFGI